MSSFPTGTTDASNAAMVGQVWRTRDAVCPAHATCFVVTDQSTLLGVVLLRDLAAPEASLLLLDFLASTASSALVNAMLRRDIARESVSHGKADTELAFKHNLLRTLVHHIPFRTYAQDHASRFLFGNNRMARLARVATPGELCGKADYDFSPHELAANYFADEMHALDSGQSLLDYGELVADQDTGELGWTVTTKVLLRDEDGIVNGSVGIGYDVTQRKKMEARMLERTQALEQANASEVKYKAEVIKQYSGVPETLCLPSQINQVFLNLLINAAHATGFLPRSSPPSQSAKARASACRSCMAIVHSHKGTIDVTSSLGRGTMFTVRLPR